MTPYTFQRGETLSLALDAVTGDPLAVTAIDAVLKAVPPGRTGVQRWRAGCGHFFDQSAQRVGRHSAGVDAHHCCGNFGHTRAGGLSC